MMLKPWQFYLLLTILCLITQGFFAMMEMACVSFNKVRLQYYVSKNHRRAIWLSYLLNRPGLLFGTALIGITTSLMVGSECARRLYDSLGFNPDWSPLTQIVLVIIFAEVAPMFAGRRYAEHAAMLGIPLLYFCSILLRPVIWVLDLLCRGLNYLIGNTISSDQYLSREELQNIIEEREEAVVPAAAKKEFNTVVANIFSLKNKIAKELMQPLTSVQMIPSFCTVGEMRAILSTRYSAYLPIYHSSPQNIVAVAYPRDLLRIQDNKRVREQARPPWFITEKNSILQILKQFRRNNQSVAVVLNDAGLATGVLTLDEIVDEIFGRADEWMSFGDVVPRTHHIIVDRSFPGDMLLAEFNAQFHVHLGFDGAETLEELMTKALGHLPSKGESVRVDQFELIVEEASLLGAKMISVRTVF